LQHAKAVADLLLTAITEAEQIGPQIYPSADDAHHYMRERLRRGLADLAAVQAARAKEATSK